MTTESFYINGIREDICDESNLDPDNYWTWFNSLISNSFTADAKKIESAIDEVIAETLSEMRKRKAETISETSSETRKRRSALKDDPDMDALKDEPDVDALKRVRKIMQLRRAKEQSETCS
jgi:hypothetical protein